MKALCLVLGLTTLLMTACGTQTVDEVKTVKFDYVNEKFAFGINLPKDYRVQYLTNGVVFKKDVVAAADYDASEPEDDLAPYTVEMAVLPFGNLSEQGNLQDYVAAKYSDYSLAGVSFNGIFGYFVDEGLGKNAIRHFFTMNQKGDIIYEAYLKMPSFHFALYEKEFTDLLETFNLL